MSALSRLEEHYALLALASQTDSRGNRHDSRGRFAGKVQAQTKPVAKTGGAPAGTKLTPAGHQTYHVHHNGEHAGLVTNVNIRGAGKGWTAFDHHGHQLDAFEATRAEAVGVLVKHHLRSNRSGQT